MQLSFKTIKGNITPTSRNPAADQIINKYHIIFSLINRVTLFPEFHGAQIQDMSAFALGRNFPQSSGILC